MKIHPTELPGLLLVEPDVYRDARGYFMETWNEPRYARSDMVVAMKQDNVSWSKRGVLRGLHFQNPHQQAKLVSVLVGEIFDVAVDVRRDSPTFGRWCGCQLSADNARQLYIPHGFAHGFCVLSDSALVAYKCSEVYRPESELTIHWQDPQLSIHWPIAEPILSPKDIAAPKLDDIPVDRLPRFGTAVND